MTDRPIIFSAPMIRALLDGRKTMTRRVAWKVEPVFSEGGVIYDGAGGQMDCVEPECVVAGIPSAWQRVAGGDRLWVRETWCPVNDEPYGGNLWVDYRATPEYEASRPAGWHEAPNDPEALRWRPSIHMPRWASRLTLIVETVKVERLQDISEEDAEAEGLKKLSKDGGRVWKYGIPDRDGLPGNEDGGWHWQHWRISPIDAYARLWDDIHGPGAWAANPWVVAIGFRVVRGNIDAAEVRAA